MLKPTGIIGVSTVPKLFNRQVIETSRQSAEAGRHPGAYPRLRLSPCLPGVNRMIFEIFDSYADGCACTEKKYG
jgi:hypothetical protein